jgi:hypothetical protein
VASRCAAAPPPSAASAAPVLAPAEALAAAAAGARRMRQATLEELYEMRLVQAAPTSFPRTPGTFELMETVRGKRMNTLSGLLMFRDVLSPAEQEQTLAYDGGRS